MLIYLRPASWAAPRPCANCNQCGCAPVSPAWAIQPATTSTLPSCNKRNRKIGRCAAKHIGEDDDALTMIDRRYGFCNIGAARSMRSSGPMQMAFDLVCLPTTCSRAWMNSSARRPWVTITKPIMHPITSTAMLSPHSLEGMAIYAAHCEVGKRSLQVDLALTAWPTPPADAPQQTQSWGQLQLGRFMPQNCSRFCCIGQSFNRHGQSYKINDEATGNVSHNGLSSQYVHCPRTSSSPKWFRVRDASSRSSRSEKLRLIIGNKLQRSNLSLRPCPRNFPTVATPRWICQHRAPPNQHGSAVQAHAGGVQALVTVISAPARGSNIIQRRQLDDKPGTKNALSPSAFARPKRFSAQMRPLWASTICREIARPKPELLPKLCSGLSV